MLIGRLKVLTKSPSFDELEEEMPELESGGRYRPRECRARHRMAIIIPYRDREEHLRTFLLNIHPMLERQQLDYGIYIVEEDLSRRVVKTEWAAIEIPELEFEITKQTGLITTVEGILERAIDGLKHTIKSFTDEDLLLSENVSSRQKLCDFVLKLSLLKEGNESFTFVLKITNYLIPGVQILSDISGNSYVESLCAPPAVDPQVDSTRFIRTIDEDKLLGIYEFGVDNDRTATEETQAVANKLQDEVLRFPTNCPNCSAPAFTNMKVQQIPHFKEVVIMATNCDACGHKTNEVKSGSGIEDKGIRITLKVADESDLERDVSDTCSLAIPELDIHMSGTGSGRYTTVEGIASTIIDDLKRHNPFVFGDSAKEDVRQRMSDLAAKLESLVGRTLVLNDPCGNSYVSGDGLDVERYERSYDQNEELGLNDIKTENYS
ncbi:unnamed protein product [Medioppia subpectinata]|uniref:Zinc finger ZPR1-type domain-containing protein n=1 Tax=Medioppia subpectinata TaxID=1979941 RepID=A0A7R9Q3R4_9ACAR|nr:unnamed protein product [Medioppia subpectinata]CAG2110787.1 unnamed protein product [Medioppia subpectinata]